MNSSGAVGNILVFTFVNLVTLYGENRIYNCSSSSSSGGSSGSSSSSSFLALILHFRRPLLQICVLGLRLIGSVPENYLSCPEATD